MYRIIFVIFFSISLASCSGHTPYASGQWEKCDGLPAPQSLGGKMMNMGLLIGSLALKAEIPNKPNLYYIKNGRDGVTACTQVLNSGIFSSGSNWERHTNILKARAIHHIENKNSDAALSDLAAIGMVAGTYANNIYYQRSLGLSVKFLQALAFQTKGNQQAADLRFNQLADMRSYSKNFQSLVWRHLSDGRMELTERLVQLDSQYLYLHATMLGWKDGQEEKAADNWAHLAEGGYNKSSRFQYTRLMSGNKNIRGGEVADPDTLGRAAIAAARVNRMHQARKWIERAKIGLMATPQNIEESANIVKRLRSNSSSGDKNKVMHHEVIVNTYAQFYAGNIAGARESLGPSFKNFSVSAPVMDLIERLQKNLPTEQRVGVLGLDRKSVLKKIRADLMLLNKKERDVLNSLFIRLPILEKKSQINSYSGKIWFLKESGFSEEKLDDGTYLIKFTGDSSSSTIVEEMSLLRAADLAKKASKLGFIIIDFNNYSRTRYASYNGVQSGLGTHAGYMTSIKVAFVDPNNFPEKWNIHKGRIFNAGKVWRDLSPIYIKSKKR